MKMLKAPCLAWVIALATISNVVADFCCTWDYMNCGNSEWCSTSESNCGACNGVWLDPDADPTCTLKNWKRCEFDDDQCCGGDLLNCRVQEWGSGHCRPGPPTTLMPIDVPVHIFSDDGWYLERAQVGNEPGSSLLLRYFVPSGTQDEAPSWWTLKHIDNFVYNVKSAWGDDSMYLNRQDDNMPTREIGLDELVWWKSYMKFVFLPQDNGMYNVVNVGWNGNIEGEFRGYLTKGTTPGSVYLSAKNQESNQLWHVSAADIAPTTSSPTPAPSLSPTVSPTISPSSQPSSSPTTSAAPTSTFVDIAPGASVTLTAGRPKVLRKAGSNEILTLTGGDGKPAARSYDGGDWEPVHPLLLTLACDGVDCSITLPTTGASTFILTSQVAKTMTKEEKASRLLVQTTFGPTDGLISRVADMTAEKWIEEQIQEEPTLHRAHARERQNQRLRQPSHPYGTRDPCEAGSRWNRFAFSKMDLGKTLKFETTETGTILLKIDDIPRTELPADQDLPIPLVNKAKICSVAEYVGGDVLVVSSDATMDMCIEDMADILANPTVDFRDSKVVAALNLPDARVEDLSPTVLNTKMLKSLKDGCSFAATYPIFLKARSSPDYSGDATFYVGDSRIELVDNSLGSTNQRRSSALRTCPTAPKTFLNQDSCRIAPDCSAPSYNPTSITLNDATIRQFYHEDNLFVYRLNGLRLEGSEKPCESESVYRWTRRDSLTDGQTCSGGDSAMDGATKASLIDAIRTETNRSPTALAIDVVRSSYTCGNTGSIPSGAQVHVEGKGCWTHSHPDEWSVFDLSYWIMMHPGNRVARENGKPHPIAKHAETDASTTLTYPDWKNMDFWESSRGNFAEIGRYGEVVDFAALDARVQGPRMAAKIGATVSGWSDPGFEVCGSPGEVANVPASGNQYVTYKSGDQGSVTMDTLDQDHENWRSSSMVWATVSLDAVDQLRQRVAWALSQIFVVTIDSGNDQDSESWGHYHDIFVRHAFGDFKDILKEVSFSPLMGVMLTFMGSKSLSYNVEETGSKLFPDENYAREIWQLFSIGLWKLNDDGTLKVDESGDNILTYDNKDIMSMARGWTGLERADGRANYESWDLNRWRGNNIDPMQIMTRDTRDVFPKLGLDDNGRKYVGDKIQRCDSMPEKAFLKKGAIYRYLGSSSTSELGRSDPGWWADNNGWNPRLVLDETSSELFGELCNEVNGKCNFQSHVVLSRSLECDGSCYARSYGGDESKCECSIDEPRVVRLDGSTKTGTHLATYYEYVRAPCVRLAFPEAGHSITVQEREEGGGAICADTRLPEATSACCSQSSDVSTEAIANCVFQGERVTFDTSQQRCVANAESGCDFTSVKANYQCGFHNSDSKWGHWKAGMRFAWTNSPCSVKAQVNDQGEVAIIHDVAPLTIPVKKRVALDYGTHFRVMWKGDGSFPTAPSCGGGCHSHDGTCVCDATVTTTAVFTAPPSSLVEIHDKLHIGAADPATFKAGTYSVCTDTGCSTSDFRVYTEGGSAIDEHSIIEVFADDGTSIFLLNAESTVSVGGKSFRNPPMMNSLVDQSQRDALYEIDEMLELYNSHSNVAPFIATRLTQLLVTSNPSPTYVAAVSAAFKSGRFVSNGSVFGNGKYGNLKATIAAVLLHAEARSATLDLDPTFGSVREPILQLMHWLRAMDISAPEEREIRLIDLQEKIGQEPFNAPSVFSFFLNEFSPAGPVNDAGLVSPQSQVLNAPTIIDTINGLAALPVFGLTECEWGRGLGDSHERYILPDHPEEGRFSCDQAGDLDDTTPSAPFRFGWEPTTWKLLGLPNPDSGVNSPSFSLDNAPFCGCSDCTQDIWNAMSGSNLAHSCGARIRWTDSQTDRPNGADACHDIARQDGYYPQCGPNCDPARCDIDHELFRPVAEGVVAEMDLLLTGGRLDPANRDLMEEAYIQKAARRDISRQAAHESALRRVQQLFAMTPEFRITNHLSLSGKVREQPEETLPEDPEPVTGYKAIVYLFLGGGMDSFNLVVPMDGCGSTDLPNQYRNVRDDVAIPNGDLLRVEDDTGKQPCTGFGLHPSMTHVRSLYNKQEAAVMAGIGPLVEPLTKKDYEQAVKDIPPALFAHNTQTDVTQTVVPQDKTANGVLGRLGDALNDQESAEIFDAYSISGSPAVLEGAPGISRPADVLSGSGVAGLTRVAESIQEDILKLHQHEASSIFGETVSAKVSSTFSRMELLGNALQGSSLSNPSCWTSANSYLGYQFRTVATVMKQRDALEAKRDVFYVQHGGYDTHSDNGAKLEELLGDVDAAIQCFTQELESQGIWGNVTLVTASEFGRTLTSNGLGTDHGWAGNHLVMGGALNGKRFFGEYPSDITETAPLNIGRGRMIPTMSWDAVWNAVVQWFGLESSRIGDVLPNAKNFNNLIGLTDLYK